MLTCRPVAVGWSTFWQGYARKTLVCSFQSFRSSSFSFTISTILLSSLLLSPFSHAERTPLHLQHHHFYSHLRLLFFPSRFMFYYCSFRSSLVLLTPVSPAGIFPVSVVFPTFLAWLPTFVFLQKTQAWSLSGPFSLPLVCKSRCGARTIGYVHPCCLSSETWPVELFWRLDIAGVVVGVWRVTAGLELQCNQTQVPWSHVGIPLLHGLEWGATGVYSYGRGLKL